jgi:hypothetical protein
VSGFNKNFTLRRLAASKCFYEHRITSTLIEIHATAPLRAVVVSRGAAKKIDALPLCNSRRA